MGRHTGPAEGLAEEPAHRERLFQNVLAELVERELVPHDATHRVHECPVPARAVPVDPDLVSRAGP